MRYLIIAVLLLTGCGNRVEHWTVTLVDNYAEQTVRFDDGVTKTVNLHQLPPVHVGEKWQFDVKRIERFHYDVYGARLLSEQIPPTPCKEVELDQILYTFCNGEAIRMKSK